MNKVESAHDWLVFKPDNFELQASTLYHLSHSEPFTIQIISTSQTSVKWCLLETLTLTRLILFLFTIPACIHFEHPISFIRA